VVLGLTAYFTRCSWLPLFGGQCLGTGDVQATLTWSTNDDLDLWVTDPIGEVIYFSHKNSFSGGQLDVDANAGCNNVTPSPVENIFWPRNGAPGGPYRVEVQYYRQCESRDPISYHVRLLVDRKVSEFDGTINTQGDRQLITAFER
jgi:uncharacterized protein YfaP (DUF2135 family)